MQCQKYSYLWKDKILIHNHKQKNKNNLKLFITNFQFKLVKYLNLIGKSKNKVSYYYYYLADGRMLIESRTFDMLRSYSTNKLLYLYYDWVRELWVSIPNLNLNAKLY